MYTNLHIDIQFIYIYINDTNKIIDSSWYYNWQLRTTHMSQLFHLFERERYMQK